jgi:gliding motility-associated-like protein
VGGCAPYTYAWSTGATTQDLSGLGAGSYTVTVTDGNGCTYSESWTLTQPAILTITDTVSTYSCGYNVTCNGATNGSVDIMPAGGCAPYTYAWSTGATTQDLAGLGAGSYTVTVTDGNGCTLVSSFVLSEPTMLTATSVLSSYSCGYNVSVSGGADGSVDVTPAGGCLPYAFVWSNGAVSEDVSGLTAGTYSFTLTDANGCTFADTLVLTEPLPLLASGVMSAYSCGYQISCNGASDGSIDVTVSGGCSPYATMWSTGSTSEDLSGLSAGTYQVTITDDNLNDTVLVFVLTEPAPVSLTLVPATYAGGANVSCNGANDGSVNLSIAGGCAPYAVLWSNGDTLEDADTLAAGTYGVTVTDANGCTATSAVVLTEPAPLASSMSPLTFNGGWNISCNGLADGFVDLSVSGGSGSYTYAWSNGSTAQDLALVGAGAYQVTITDENGCFLVDSITLTEPDPVALLLQPSVYAGGFNIRCNGGSDGAVDLTVSGGTPGYLYLWSNASFGEDLSGVDAGTYVVLVTDANGCIAADTITLTEPTAVALTSTALPSGCAGGNTGAIDLTASGGVPAYSFAWSNGATTEDLSGLGAGTFTVTVTDANGCTASLTETVTEASPIALTDSVTNATCNGTNDGEIDLTVSGGTSPYVFAWSNGATTEDLTGLAPGTYSVLVIDGNSCTDTLAAVVTEPPPIAVSAGQDLATCEDHAALSASSPGPGQTGFWTLLSGSGTLTFPNDSTTTVTGLSLGGNTFAWTVSEGVCSASDTMLVLYQECGPYPLEMPTAYSPNNDGANDYFVIRNIEHYPDNTFSVYNRWGNLLYSQNSYLNQWHGQSNAAPGEVPDGTYFVILVVNGGEIQLHGYVDLRR